MFSDLKNNNTGFTLIEVMISMVLLSIIFLGTVQYFVFSGNQIQKGVRSQEGYRLMVLQVERALTLDYVDLSDSLSESNTQIDVNNINAFRSTVLLPVDDPLDGLSPVDLDIPDYYQMNISVAWFTQANIQDSLSYQLTPDRYASY